MRSLIIKGLVDKSGNVTARLNNVQSLSRNEWEFRISSVIICPKKRDISEVFELGCSLNNSECFDYNKSLFMDKNTPLCLLNINCEKGRSQKVDLSQSSCPWLKLENVKDTIEVSFFQPGTSIQAEKGIFSVILHMWIRRK